MSIRGIRKLYWGYRLNSKPLGLSMPGAVFSKLLLKGIINGYTKYIEINPKVMMGKPVIKGTRITVELILEKLSKGETIQDILIAYPQINQEAIYAALAYAASMI